MCRDAHWYVSLMAGCCRSAKAFTIMAGCCRSAKAFTMTDQTQDLLLFGAVVVMWGLGLWLFGLLDD